MFRKIEITNSNRHEKDKKVPPIPMANLFKYWSFEKAPMPYFSIVPEQCELHAGYQSLTADDQGHFLRLILIIAGPGMRGRFDNSLRIFEKVLGLPRRRSEILMLRLLETKVLVASEDGYDLIQPELREQCLLYLAGDKPKVNRPELWAVETTDEIDSGRDPP